MRMIDKVETSKMIAKIIEKSGLKQAEIAEKCGMSVENFNAYCTGRRFPSLDTLFMIADALGYKVDDMLIVKEVDYGQK